MKNNVFLIDDDKNILASVSILLETEGYKVSTFSDGESGLKAILESSPDIAVVDIKMPRLDGIELLKKLRKTSDMPVIFLTSKDTEIDELLGLKVGADDYITKPFSQKILIERIRILIKRYELKNSKKNEEVDEKNSLKKGDIFLDTEKYMCKWKNKVVDLTVTEFLLIKSLVDNLGVVKSRDQLIISAFGENKENIDDRSIDHHFKRIRKKFKKLDKSFNSIVTVYGGGYKFSE
ncbi:MAG: Transcriptional regulatory protein BaeR [Alphaproteobacteria bacterium MarineAlpha6_Bin6]|nr:DNA-binding response regulator [Pelagibacteraceae bacterium]PPR29451.1 MAG: Transcriptional regulatory protein BaeR [Alphaproteobacteria bacterium MarineAlpha6_Bin6]PPR33626.1 MAG: Transcriptional regulatory protein BaeR [Alphaproteobacteria bacterium MarineAlpha6_Bin5]|tara:strand:+ start:1403 stop:2107 length:705 start_codon:yes stop_codon:yes gene_type:complete